MLCSVFSVEANRFVLIFLEGKGLPGGVGLVCSCSKVESLWNRALGG